ncbi:nucleotidyltransferase domain-containing protein [Kitasatospora cystarginea]|uniref:Nucleotidyltransferase domain-containing protein n=1 Tax=Kitasatospora cystarginea TaxID=58350 RepID=A0ABN3DZH0_9ACTN
MTAAGIETTDRGLDADGYIAREGALSRVPDAFAPVVEAARTRIADSFGPSLLHSAYLYGSIPRGTAVPGVCDLDLLLALRREPTADDRAAAADVLAALDAEFPQIMGGGVLLFSEPVLLSELERYDLGWFLACLCTPLLGEDLAARLPRYRPSSLLARETNGDLAAAIPRWRERLAEAVAAEGSEDELRALGRSVSRRLVRTGFTLVMPRWGGWTSDLTASVEIFARYYPERAERMRTALTVARTRSGDAALLTMLVEELAPWLAAEYTAVHGEKAPRG